MEFEIWKESPEPGKEPARVRLLQIGTRIILSAVDAQGAYQADGILLLITQEGKFLRAKGVNPSLGFQLDAWGRILLDEWQRS